MNLSAGKAYHVFKNGPNYRHRQCEEDNVIDFSSFKQFQAHLSSRSFSIKYVQSGLEIYNLDGREYNIGKEEYLLTNAFTDLSIVIDNVQYAKGACIELSPALLAEVVAINHDPASPYPQKDFYDFLTGAGFFERSYKAGKTNLGSYLRNTISHLSADGFAEELQASDFFYNIAEKVITDQRELHKYIHSFDSVKNSTRKDLLHRLLNGKELMDDCYTERLIISEIARAATMSEYYFFRLFKKVFNCSPHRYLVNRRLQKATELLRAANDPIATIALNCGYTDIHTFSKAFKKRFGRNPGFERQFGKKTL